jgi:hypothetical protein
MWFDVQQALAKLAGGDMPPATLPPATTATTATRQSLSGPTLDAVATVANVAAPPARNREIGRAADAERLAEMLATAGPTTYGAAAVALGWGATRAWQAEAHLRAAGKVRFDALGRAALTKGKSF